MPPKRSKPQHQKTKRIRVARPETGPPAESQSPTAKSEADSPVYFWRMSDPAGYLSQWYPCAFSDDKDPSITYPTAEHYMMHQKAVLFSDLEVGAEILATLDPREVKALGRKVSNFSDAVWNARREEIVRRGNLLKFTRPVDPEDGWWMVQVDGEGGEGGESVSIRELLLRTGDREIVEASPLDRIWGIGFSAAKAESMRKRWGLNLLGKALMAVREELRKEAKGQEGAPKSGKGSDQKKGERRSATGMRVVPKRERRVGFAPGVDR
ncbi:uncharacterized protein P884DRAFT_208233 [Thermothelomyces heterothallicus CBS 202.75]|uniref:uncharacterized protein n=1 Tax=Thermothelomyces heterothallicus CBS 202.75 TaxID=1149848 RepID=UPI0037431C7C